MCSRISEKNIKLFLVKYLYGHFSLDGWDILVLEDLGPKSVPPWTPRRTGSIMRAFGAFHVAGRALALPTWLKPPSEWVNDASHLWAWTSDRDAIAQRAVVAGTRATEAARWFEAIGSTCEPERRSSCSIVMLGRTTCAGKTACGAQKL
jgi:hypothetical protein